MPAAQIISRSGVRSIRTSSVCPMISPPHRVFGENAKGNISAFSSSVRLQKEELLSSGEQEIFRRFQIFYIGRRTFLHKKEPHRTNGFLCDSVMREQSGSCCSQRHHVFTQAQPQKALVPVRRYKRYLSSSLLVFHKEIV